MPQTVPAAKLHFLTGRSRVQQRSVFGKHERFRWAIFAVKYTIFLALPWIPVGGAQAVYFDIPHRRYHLFGQVFWPQDFYLLGLFFALAAIMLFFSTTLLSRSWCGFACPQTLLSHLFMKIDGWIEGDRPARLALDRGTAPPAAVARRVLKHAVWLAVSALLGYTFARYFATPTDMFAGWPLATWAFITGLTYLFAGHLRDWVCATVCPYGRFQGAMQDMDSLVVTYDRQRGEPRGKGKATIARGGCVDCNQCALVCPMGIDIRNGPQYECITCLRCIDACDATMKLVGAEPNLIRLASQREVEAHASAPETPWEVRGARHWLRPRVLWYGTVLGGLVLTLGTLLAQRPLLAIDAQRDATRVFTLGAGRASDLYHLELLNKDARPHRVRVSLEGLPGQLVGLPAELTLAPGAIAAYATSVVAEPSAAPRPFRFQLVDAATNQPVGACKAVFVSPGGR